MIRKLLKLSTGLIGALIAFLLTKICAAAPTFTENVYSRAIYPAISKFLAALTKGAKFSIVEIIAYIFVAYILFSIVYIIFAFFKPKGTKLFEIAKRFLVFLIVICSVYTSFVLFWGLNYYRQPLSKSMNLEMNEYSTEDLTQVCETLAERANALRKHALEDNTGVFTLNSARDDVLAHIGDIYDTCAPDYMNLGPKARIKKVQTKNLLSITQTTGIYAPFTAEPNINMQMPDLYFPVTAAHEYAHLQGFAREDEANFIAWYVLAQSNEVEYSYSAYALALSYSLNALAAESPTDFNRIYMTLDEGIKADYAAQNEYWAPFDTKFAEKSGQIYESFLDSNGVEDGLKSYGRMIDLIIALYKADKFPSI